MKKTRTRRPRARCESCNGLGFILSETSGSNFCPDRTLQAQRCDKCMVLPSDDVAQEIANRILSTHLGVYPMTDERLAAKLRGPVLRRWRAEPKPKSMSLFLHPKAVARELTVSYGRRRSNRGDDALYGVYDKFNLRKLPLALPFNLHSWLAGALREGVTFEVFEDDTVRARIGGKR